MEGVLRALKLVNEGVGIGAHSVQRRPYISCIFEMINDHRSLEGGAANINRMEIFNFMTKSEDGLQDKAHIDVVFDVSNITWRKVSSILKALHPLQKTATNKPKTPIVAITIAMASSESFMFFTFRG